MSSPSTFHRAPKCVYCTVALGADPLRYEPIQRPGAAELDLADYAEETGVEIELE